MATAAPNAPLPLFYQGIQPLSKQLHSSWKMKAYDMTALLKENHAVPLTVEEFASAQRHFPIVFSAGDNPVPLALMGLNEGVNVFATGEETGAPFYIPAYARRYPFMLAKIREGTDELSLCFDPASGVVGEAIEGEALFQGEEISDTTKAILGFCEQFELAGTRTNQFMIELKNSGLLMDGEVSIQPSDAAQPYVYRGFQMVDEKKLQDMRGDELRKLNQNGVLSLIYAHLFSLPLIRDIFARQQQGGMLPPQPPEVPSLESAGTAS